MEISMNLLPFYSAHSVSYRLMNWAGFPVSILVVINMGLGMDSHIDENAKV